MILLWLKIIYYKITKPAPRLRNRAHPGTDTGNPRARHVRVHGTGNLTAGGDVRLTGDISPEVSALPPVTISPARLQEMIDAGLICDPDGDLMRVQLFEAEREARQTEALLTHDPRHCPCSGRHYPSPSACRWCACHRPSEMIRMDRDVPPYPVTDDQIRETLMAVRPSDEIELCGACGHPQHDVGDGRCASQVPPGLILCPCRIPYAAVDRVEEPDSLAATFDREHGDGTFPGEYPVTDEAVDAAWETFLGTDESEDDR